MLLEEESRAPRLLHQMMSGNAMKPLTCHVRRGARFVWRVVALMPGIRLQCSPRRVQNCRSRPTTCSSLGTWILPSSTAVSRRCSACGDVQRAAYGNLRLDVSTQGRTCLRAKGIWKLFTSSAEDKDHPADGSSGTRYWWFDTGGAVRDAEDYGAPDHGG